MSSTTTTPSPNDLTRQQLDELDALLQRMLSLPLNSPPTPAPSLPVAPAPSYAPPSGWRFDPPAPPRPAFSAEDVEELRERVAAPAVTMAAASARPADVPGTQNLADVPAWMFAPEPAPVAGPLRGVDAPALPSGYRPPVEPAPLQSPMVEPLVEAAPVPLVAAVEPQRIRVPVVLWPLFAVNWLLEVTLGLFGPVGAVLTHPVVKHLLGVAGIVLLAVAAAWSARGMGWVKW